MTRLEEIRSKIESNREGIDNGDYFVNECVLVPEEVEFLLARVDELVAALGSAIAGREVTSGDEADSIGVALAGWRKIHERLMEVE